MNPEKLLQKIRFHNWVILMITGSLSFLFMSKTFTMGLILGGLIIIGNFGLLQKTIRAAFPTEGAMKIRIGTIIMKFYFRLAILGLIIYILITNGWVNPLGLTAGLSIVVITIFYVGIQAVFRTSSREAV